ncbi:MAG: putative lipopolysaccharide heptosyltransferase III [Rhabdochlamydiaceae bacterium]|nr:putative lipopolysaccharide heptosyltransferase III [Rhabdochlamydiaceae bacterium]
MNYGNYPDLSRVKKALIIKLRHHGDVLLTSPVFSYLKSQLPEAAIDALIYQETAPMLEGHPAIRKLHLYDKKWKKQSFFKRWKEELSLLKTVRKEKYDLVINLTEGDRGAVLSLVSGAPICVGLDPEKKGFLGKSRVFSHLVKPCKTPRHTVEKNLDALRRIGLFPSPEERELSFHIPPDVKARVAQMVPDSYIVIHPVSRWKFKCWPIEHVAELIKTLHQEGSHVVLTASSDPAEMRMIAEIIALCPGIPLTSLAGQIDLKELGAVIAGGVMLICVDSVPLHISSALKTPVCVLFGPTSELNWGPWRNPHARVITQQMSCRPCFMDGCGGSKRSDCLTTLSVKQVFKEVRNFLAHKK